MAIWFCHFVPPKIFQKHKKNNNTSPSAETLPAPKLSSSDLWCLWLTIPCDSFAILLRSSDRLCVFCSSGSVKFPLCLFRAGLLIAWAILTSGVSTSATGIIFVHSESFLAEPPSFLACAFFSHSSFRASCCFFKIGKHRFRCCFLLCFSFSVTVL